MSWQAENVVLRLAAILAEGRAHLLGMKVSSPEKPPGKESVMNMEIFRRAPLGAAVLFFLSWPAPAAAQLVGDEAPSKSQQLAKGSEQKQAAPDAPATPHGKPGALLQTKTFTLEGSKVWTDTGIKLEPGQRI